MKRALIHYMPHSGHTKTKVGCTTGKPSCDTYLFDPRVLRAAVKGKL